MQNISVNCVVTDSVANIEWSVEEYYKSSEQVFEGVLSGKSDGHTTDAETGYERSNLNTNIV